METIQQTTWYESLNKSNITPPDYVFPIVWSILYISISIAAGLFIKAGGLSNSWGITFFTIQLALNLSWSPVFFKYRKIGLGLLICIGMWVSILATIIAFGNTSPLAAYILIPYLVWVSLATYLNGYIYANN